MPHSAISRSFSFLPLAWIRTITRLSFFILICIFIAQLYRRAPTTSFLAPFSTSISSSPSSNLIPIRTPGLEADILCPSLFEFLAPADIAHKSLDSLCHRQYEEYLLEKFFPRAIESESPPLPSEVAIHDPEIETDSNNLHNNPKLHVQHSSSQGHAQFYYIPSLMERPTWRIRTIAPLAIRLRNPRIPIRIIFIYILSSSGWLPLLLSPGNKRRIPLAPMHTKPRAEPTGKPAPPPPTPPPLPTRFPKAPSVLLELKRLQEMSIASDEQDETSDNWKNGNQLSDNVLSSCCRVGTSVNDSQCKPTLESLELDKSPCHFKKVSSPHSNNMIAFDHDELGTVEDESQGERTDRLAAKGCQAHNPSGIPMDGQRGQVVLDKGD